MGAHCLRLGDMGTLHGDGSCRLEDLITEAQSGVRIEVARYRQHHVVQVVEAVIAAIEQVGVDPGDGLHGTGDVDAQRMLLIERTEQVEVHLPVGVIVIHADLLPDDALFLGNRSLGEIGLGDKLQ